MLGLNMKTSTIINELVKVCPLPPTGDFKIMIKSDNRKTSWIDVDVDTFKALEKLLINNGDAQMLDSFKTL